MTTYMMTDLFKGMLFSYWQQKQSANGCGGNDGFDTE